ncbi:MAG TPA: transglutaminase family protein [Acidimicrobiales bacterium]
MRRFDGWRLRTDHVTRFSYPLPARASYNEVRKIPQSTGRQTSLDARVHTTPNVAQYGYRDYWGTPVVAFNVDGPHEELLVHGEALVETHPPADPPGATWAEVAVAGTRFAELMTASRFTEPSPALAAAAAELVEPTPTQTIERVVGWVHGALHYVPGVTSVKTSATEAFESGRGVCQDFAHLALSVLRLCGIPARYVSGYLHPDPEATVGLEAVGESHAWIEAWAGDWWGLDPTNDIPIGLRHILVARGRDYGDVAPIKGIYAGGSDHSVEVAVRITRTV